MLMHDTAPPIIVVVDDDRETLDFICALLSEMGVIPVGVQDSSRAQTTIAQARPRVIILDVEMPGRDGFHLVEAIRGHGGFADLPVIALSSGVSPEAIEQARKLKISQFVAKFDRSGLVSALAETQPVLGEAA